MGQAKQRGTYEQRRAAPQGDLQDRLNAARYRRQQQLEREAHEAAVKRLAALDMAKVEAPVTLAERRSAAAKKAAATRKANRASKSPA